MLARIVLKRGAKSEGESPFWISFSDLMSALMTLFLVVMAVTLVTITQSISAEDAAKIQREKDIKSVMAQIRKASEGKPVEVNESTYKIDLGELVRFDSGDFSLKPESARFLRSYVPILLRAQASPEGQRWMRRVVVEGFTDQTGTYLYNLDLSLRRSQSVVCAFFASPGTDEAPLSVQQLADIQNLFLVGGYSFNSVKADKAASRRVELKIEFWAVGEQSKAAAPALAVKMNGFGKC